MLINLLVSVSGMNIALISVATLRNPKEATRITLLSLAQELKRRGHHVVVVGHAAVGYPEYEEIKGVPLYRFGFPLGSRLFFPAKAVRLLQEKLGRSFDILHGFSSTPLFALSLALAKGSAPHTKVIHTLRSSSRFRGGNTFYSCLRLADKVTVPSMVFWQQVTSGLIPVPSTKIAILRSWIDLTKFRPQDKQRLKKKYGYVGRKIVFHYGAMWHNKGTGYLVEAIPFLRDQNLLFIFAPRYQDIGELSQKITARNIQDQVEVITADIPISEYVAMADVVVLPYVSLQGTEGNPSCLLEAMACKTAVVTTDLPELQEITEDSVFLAQPADVHSLAENITAALSPSPDSRKMIEHAYHLAQNFSVVKAGQDILTLYKKALQGGAAAESGKSILFQKIYKNQLSAGSEVNQK